MTLLNHFCPSSCHFWGCGHSPKALRCGSSAWLRASFDALSRCARPLHANASQELVSCFPQLSIYDKQPTLRLYHLQELRAFVELLYLEQPMLPLPLLSPRQPLFSHVFADQPSHVSSEHWSSFSHCTRDLLPRTDGSRRRALASFGYHDRLVVLCASYLCLI